MGCKGSRRAKEEVQGDYEEQEELDMTRTATVSRTVTGSKSVNTDASGMTEEEEEESDDDTDFTMTKSTRTIVNVDTRDVYKAKMQLLNNVTLFSRLPRDMFLSLVDVAEEKTFKKKNSIVKQGEVGDNLFMIRKGEAKIMVKDGDPKSKSTPSREVGTLSAGDYFGEKALLRASPWPATVTATSATSVFKIPRRRFQRLGLNDHLEVSNRRAVVGDDRRKNLKGIVEKVDADHADLVGQALRENPLLSQVTDWTTEKVEALVGAAWQENIPKGTDVFVAGDVNADLLYIVAEGSFRVGNAEEEIPLRPSMEQIVSEGEVLLASKAGPGSCFGELAMLYLAVRPVTAHALENSIVVVIDRGRFREIITRSPKSAFAEQATRLDDVPELAKLLPDERTLAASALVDVTLSKGEAATQQGQPATALWILVEGSVEVVKDGRVQKTLSGGGENGGMERFGVGALLQEERSEATMRVASDTARFLVLERATFDALLGPLKEIQEEKESNRQSRVKPLSLPARAIEDQPFDRIAHTDLQRVGVLGYGGFGTVDLYEHKVTGSTYALKALGKGFIRHVGLTAGVYTERDILRRMSSPFIVRFYESYGSAQSLFLLMEACLGGDLMLTYSRKGFHGSEDHARFYSAAVVLALEHLHEFHIAYRDLKPENMLLTEHGHIKLVDMGLAKLIVGKTFTVCGTPEYFAPEMVRMVGHTRAVDWWALGVLLFELLTGFTPSEGGEPPQILVKVSKGFNSDSFPEGFPTAAAELIRALLQTDPGARLPARPSGVQALKAHSFFANLDWEQMAKRQITPPHVPVVKSRKDMSNFGARRSDMPPQLSYQRAPGDEWDKTFATLG